MNDKGQSIRAKYIRQVGDKADDGTRLRVAFLNLQLNRVPFFTKAKVASFPNHSRTSQMKLLLGSSAVAV